MKKMYIIITLALLALFADSAGAATFRYLSFIPGYTPAINPNDTAGRSVSLLISSNITTGIVNNTNFLLGSTNTFVTTNGQAGIVWLTQGQQYGLTYGTNAVVVSYGITNGPLGTPATGPLTIVSTAPNNATLQRYGTNAFFMVHASGATNTLGNTVDGAGLLDCNIFSDENGDFLNPSSLTLSATVCSDISTATNKVTFTFIPTYDGFNYDYTNSVTLTVYASGILPQTIRSNLTTAQASGIRRYRLNAITNSATANGGPAPVIWASQIGLSGYAP